MTTTTKMERLKEHLSDKLETATAGLTKFRQRLEEDPDYALEWGGDAFRAAAEVKLYSGAQVILEKHGIAALVKMVREKALHVAMYPPRSTSPTSNLMAQDRGAACAELLRDLEYYAEDK